MLHLGRATGGWAAVAGLAACVTVGVGVARAATVTETAPVSGHEFIDPGQDVFVPEFDAALGTLTGVSAVLTGQFTPGVVFATDSPTLPPLTVTLTPSISLNGSLQPVAGSVQSFAPQLVAAQDIGAGNGQAIGTPDTIDLSTQLSPGNLATGPANSPFSNDLDFYIIASSLNAPLPPGAFFTDDLGVLAAQLAVTFTYTPSAAVPEPASLALLGAGLLGLCAVQSRKRRSASSWRSGALARSLEQGIPHPTGGCVKTVRNNRSGQFLSQPPRRHPAAHA